MSGGRPFYDPDHAPSIDGRDAAAVVHRFLVRCRAWGADREVPARLERVRNHPVPEEAAKLHAWVAWVAFVDHALRELESGKLDDWLVDRDGV